MIVIVYGGPFALHLLQVVLVEYVFTQWGFASNKDAKLGPLH